MKITILPIGSVKRNLLESIAKSLSTVFSGAFCEILETAMLPPQYAYNTSRNQYHSSLILANIEGWVKESSADKVLAVTDVDLYVPRHNFVFGEAMCPGRTAIISLHRLKPEFYGQPSNQNLFVERSVKEAIHEIGHTLGLRHCSNPTCNMFFSSNIQSTDAKKTEFCEKCWPKILQATERLREKKV